MFIKDVISKYCDSITSMPNQPKTRAYTEHYIRIISLESRQVNKNQMFMALPLSANIFNSVDGSSQFHVYTIFMNQ